jgi:hypothetical protein
MAQFCLDFTVPPRLETPSLDIDQIRVASIPLAVEFCKSLPKLKPRQRNLWVTHTLQ